MKKVVLLFAVVAMTVLSLQAPAFAERSGGTLNFMAPYGGGPVRFKPLYYKPVPGFSGLHECSPQSLPVGCPEK